METIRQEVRALVLTTERLLSPITLGQPLNDDEKEIVAMCGQSLAEKYPMTVEVASSETGAMLHKSHQVSVKSWAVVDRTKAELQASDADIGKILHCIEESRNL